MRVLSQPLKPSPGRAYTPTCTRAHIRNAHVYAHAHAHTHTHAYAHAQAHAHAPIARVYVHVHVHVQVQVQVRTYSSEEGGEVQLGQKEAKGG